MPVAARVCAVAVVVPARDEQRLLGRCLESLAKASVGLGLDPLVIVVADHCADATADVARAAGATVVERSGAPDSGVGAARAEGCATVLGSLDGPPLDRVWLACTDADSVVPLDWIRAQLAAADDGYDAVAGQVVLGDDGPLVPDQRLRWLRAYRTRHGHVHGANLGVRASAYVAVGGFAPVQAHEDLGLVARLVAARHRVARPPGPPVVTSARLAGRAPAGVAADLRALA